MKVLTTMVGALCLGPLSFLMKVLTILCKQKPITWLMIIQMYVVHRLSMVEFVETLLYLVHLGTCDSKQRRMSRVLNLCIIPSSIKDFMIIFL